MDLQRSVSAPRRFIKLSGSSPTHTREKFWADRIKASINKSLLATLETGELLIQAKGELPHGSWLSMLKEALVHPRVAQMYMKAARNPRFVDASADSYLPATPGTLDLISRLSDKHYAAMVKDGSIHCGVSARQITEAIRKHKQRADERRILRLTPTAGKFRTLVIDPAWISEGGRGCAYALQTQEELLKLPVLQWLEDDAHVYLWATSFELENAFELLRRWGVEYRQTLIWNKIHSNGAPRIGMGHYFRNTAEFVLFGVRGSLRTRDKARSLPNTFEAPVGRHSEKPDRFYEIVREASYPSFGELYQRKPRKDFENVYRSTLEGALAA